MRGVGVWLVGVGVCFGCFGCKLRLRLGFGEWRCLILGTGLVLSLQGLFPTPYASSPLSSHLFWSRFSCTVFYTTALISLLLITRFCRAHLNPPFPPFPFSLSPPFSFPLSPPSFFSTELNQSGLAPYLRFPRTSLSYFTAVLV